MDCSLKNDRIRLDHRKYDAFPREVESVIDCDSYMMLAPVRRGDVRAISDGQVLFDGEVQPGMLRFTAPGERVRTSLRSSAEHIVLFIPGVDMRRILDEVNFHGHGRNSYIGPLIHPDHLVAKAVAACLSAGQFDEAHRQLYIDGLAYLMLARLLAGRTHSIGSRPQSSSKALSDQDFDRCCQYADAMMGKKLCLVTWAGLFGLATTEFTKRFQQKTQLSPYAWFMNRRIERAKTLLQVRRLSLAEVAFSVGFCSQSHFAEAFRRRVGCSPARWRAESSAGFR